MLNFKIEKHGSKKMVRHESGTLRVATAEEEKLWEMVLQKNRREEELLTRMSAREDELLRFIDQKAGKIEPTSIMGWYIFMRLGEVNIDQVEPKWLNIVLRDFKKLPMYKAIELLKTEFPDNFKLPKGTLCKLSKPS